MLVEHPDHGITTTTTKKNDKIIIRSTNSDPKSDLADTTIVFTPHTATVNTAYFYDNENIDEQYTNITSYAVTQWLPLPFMKNIHNEHNHHLNIVTLEAFIKELDSYIATISNITGLDEFLRTIEEGPVKDWDSYIFGLAAKKYVHRKLKAPRDAISVHAAVATAFTRRIVSSYHVCYVDYIKYKDPIVEGLFNTMIRCAHETLENIT